ncbi:hypothetical protein CJ010_14635 [Azoarcus sp. DD4]|uniref:hypothetical protein n=1 Tax=Azoarcus sp. DD4 TaxID=2027405 RepID=UPI00112810B2|nr:hypothetical protein [Azoarcus sp. DD4]QDF97679.1 hypothetical protein CJ010_14635 [Azoarcus sp. DD4]
MSYVTKGLVLGIKSFSGIIDGRKFDTTTVYVQTMLDESQGTAKGFAGASYQWGDSSNFEKVKHLPFPIEAEMTMETVTSGSKQKQVCIAFKPVGRVPDQKPAS